MTGVLQPVVFDQDDPTERGRAHGELWRDEIREVAEIRTMLCLQRGVFVDEAELVQIADAHLPILRDHAPAQYAELCGIAAGANVAPARIVILNHYTDLRDIRPAATEEGDGCTAIYTVGSDGPVLAQTWDMHASAMPYVRMIRIAPKHADTEVLCLTIAGCLGMTGISGTGVAITINNLSSTDARVGIVWPALVRAMLDEPTAAAAWARLRAAPLSSGHHYMIADGRDFFGVETSGALKVLTQTGPKAAHLHTNHCFDPVLREREAVPSTSTTYQRLNFASTLYAQLRPASADALWQLLHVHEAGAGSLCIHAAAEPHATLTCAIFMMRLRDGHVRVVHGCEGRSPPLDLVMERWRPTASPVATTRSV